MKGIEFINLIRKVIREEVRAVVKEELRALKPMILEKKAQVSERAQTQRLAPQRTTPLVTIDGALGDILRETAESMHSNPINDSENDWSSLMDMTSEDVPAIGAQVYHQPESTTSRFNSDPTAAFIKDYSAVMKAADAHQGKL